jgi:hypothetical protein
MKAGFWVAPEGESAATTLHAIEVEAPRRSAFLATLEADALIRRCPLTAGCCRDWSWRWLSNAAASCSTSPITARTSAS